MDTEETIYRCAGMLQTKCLTCLSNFRAGLIRPNVCKNACSYTGPGIAIIKHFMIHNPDFFDRYGDLNIPDGTSLYVKHPSGDLISKSFNNVSFYRGIVNAIGYVWDVHDFANKQNSHPNIERTGINHALNVPRLRTEWFVEGSQPKLQNGVNVLSFYVEQDGRFLTLHHSFVFIEDEECFLADSWQSQYECKDSEGKLCIKKYERPIYVRKVKQSELQSMLDTMNNPAPEKDAEKIKLMKETFLGVQNNDYAVHYPLFQVCILKQTILDQVIWKGFEADTYLFGGHINSFRTPVYTSMKQSTRKNIRKAIKSRKNTRRVKKLKGG
jgi:hypothetical protein